MIKSPLTITNHAVQRWNERMFHLSDNLITELLESKRISPKKLKRLKNTVNINKGFQYRSTNKCLFIIDTSSNSLVTIYRLNCI